jgi:hypothetical protein
VASCRTNRLDEAAPLRRSERAAHLAELGRRTGVLDEGLDSKSLVGIRQCPERGASSRVLLDRRHDTSHEVGRLAAQDWTMSGFQTGVRPTYPSGCGIRSRAIQDRTVLGFTRR